MKKYLPIRIHSIDFGYGWWWSNYFFFFRKYKAPFVALPMCTHWKRCTFENGLAINGGDVDSWSSQVQRDKRLDEERSFSK